MSQPWRRKEVIGDCTLYLGDCMDVTPEIGRFDVFLTDPPYGINGGSGGDSKKGKALYESDFEDTPKYILEVASEVVHYLDERAIAGAVTPGIRCMHLYHPPKDIGCFFHPAAMTHGPWGFTGMTPILYYGKDWRAGKGAISTSISVTESAEKNGHPCPKPIKAWKWLLDKVSTQSQMVVDPFMGSGTTGVACVSMGRRFIGIEMHEAYFEIACERIRKAYLQPDMFVTSLAPQMKQEEMF